MCMFATYLVVGIPCVSLPVCLSLSPFSVSINIYICTHVYARARVWVYVSECEKSSVMKPPTPGCCSNSSRSANKNQNRRLLVGSPFTPPHTRARAHTLAWIGNDIGTCCFYLKTLNSVSSSARWVEKFR